MKRFFFLFLALTFGDFSCRANLLLEPTFLTDSRFDELYNNWAYTWNWHFVNQGEIEFHYSNNKTGFILRFFNEIPAQFQHKKYQEDKEYINDKETKIFVYRFGHINTETAQCEDYREIQHKDESKLAQTIDVDDLSKFIHDKKVVFYTGAGISAAADIKTLNVLERALGVDRKNFNNFAASVLKRPQQKASHFKKFVKSLLKKNPTRAHFALTHIAQHKSTQILTENIDLLHQKTGIEPFCILPSNMNQLVKPEILNEIDALICIGMNRDNVGFLEAYKQKNKKGIIIALDINHAPYIGKGDFFLKGDVQQILPEIEKKIINF